MKPVTSMLNTSAFPGQPIDHPLEEKKKISEATRQDGCDDWEDL